MPWTFAGLRKLMCKAFVYMCAQSVMNPAIMSAIKSVLAIQLESAMKFDHDYSTFTDYHHSFIANCGLFLLAFLLFGVHSCESPCN